MGLWSFIQFSCSLPLLVGTCLPWGGGRGAGVRVLGRSWRKGIDWTLLPQDLDSYLTPSPCQLLDLDIRFTHILPSHFIGKETEAQSGKMTD